MNTHRSINNNFKSSRISLVIGHWNTRITSGDFADGFDNFMGDMHRGGGWVNSNQVAIASDIEGGFNYHNNAFETILVVVEGGNRVVAAVGRLVDVGGSRNRTATSASECRSECSTLGTILNARGFRFGSRKGAPMGGGLLGPKGLKAILATRSLFRCEISFGLKISGLRATLWLKVRRCLPLKGLSMNICYKRFDFPLQVE
jgi:hypothetical protein